MKAIILFSILTLPISFCIAQADDKIEKIDSYLIQLNQERNFSGGILIIKDGVTLLNKGYGYANKRANIPFASSTLASIGSITKLFTATAILKLYQENKLKLKDPLSKYFANVPRDKAGITIHQLLTHSGGFSEYLEGDGGDFEKIEKQEFLERAFHAPLLFTPGTKAVYTNTGMSILGMIIEKISGMDYEAYLIKGLFIPLGIKSIRNNYAASDTINIAHGYQNGKDWGTHMSHYAKAGGGPFWNLKANGGLEASLSDLFVWANAFTNKTILPDTLIEKMFAPQIMESGNGGNSFFGYGCNISKTRRGTKMIDNGGSNGIYFARLIRLPEEGLVFYMVTNESTITTNQVLPNISQLYFDGKIVRDALEIKFADPQMNKLYSLLTKQSPNDFEKNLKEQNIVVDDDIILLRVGEKLTEEGRTEEAEYLYLYYTKAFPKIVVAWNDLGDIYKKKGEKLNAKSCYQKALLLRPENQRAKEALNQLNNHN
jgi:CubicO group peptidase (beta-lactamase class C family)